MRDLKRIKSYCDALATIWEMIPDWRLSQLMVNAIHAYQIERGNPFYVEDENFLMYLYNYVKRNVNEL